MNRFLRKEAQCFKKSQKIWKVKFQINYSVHHLPMFSLNNEWSLKTWHKKHIRRLSVLEAGFRPDLFCMHHCRIKKLCTGLFFPQSIERPAGVREFIRWNPAEESRVPHCNRDKRSITSTSFSFLFTNWLSRSDFICKKNDFFPKKNENSQ